MVIRAEAQSLDILTRLADDPPLHIRKYPPRPPPPHDPHAPSSQHQLKLYVVRVPNSQDIILTPLKPQCSTVTAQDIISCLYYLRVQPLESSKPRSKSLQSEHLGGRTTSFDGARPSQPRASFSGESSWTDHLAPRGESGGYLSPSSSSITSMNSLAHHVACGADFEITFIRRDPTTSSQTTVGRIYSNHNGPLDSIPQIPNSFAAQMMAQEAMLSKKGRRDRKKLNLEIWTPGYQKFLCQRPAKSPATTVDAPDTSRPSTGGTGEGRGGFRDYLWPAPVPPPPPGFEDIGPPPPPKDSPRLSPKANPAMARISRFTEIYSPDTPVAPKQQQPTTPVEPEFDDEDADGIFKRTLTLAGESFWKSTGKRISAFHNARRKKSSEKNSYGVDEEARVAMQQMGLYSNATPSSPTSPISCPPTITGAAAADEGKKETKGKGYIFAPPVRGTGNCEFETNPSGRKIRLRLLPPNTTAGSPYGNSTVVKAEPILLSTISFQPPDGVGADARSPSPSTASFKPSGHSRASSKFKLVGEKFKAKIHGTLTEQVEHDAGSGLKSKLGSLTVEEEGMDALDMVVISCMGVFWKRYCEWTEDIREGGI
ncbi:hypothetical protein H072_3598 [Dactylellina haptotyla CBS 200.50]|uniref:Uncharacterized protein n=1 Tax=Dactylellina haptotyla (strain CBS 200.50) TaxID=1284197 RepID=S8AHC6_DACHA|nr:hypothetical protein H072_3598 [Dactylellina haptotyla CBS 200.50]